LVRRKHLPYETEEKRGPREKKPEKKVFVKRLLPRGRGGGGRQAEKNGRARGERLMQGGGEPGSKL